MSNPTHIIEDTGKRTRRLPDTRVTAEELASIKAKASSAGLTQSEYVRRMCLDGKVTVRDVGLRVEAVRQLSAIGNNLNQLTRSTHIFNDTDREALHRVLHDVGAVILNIIED